jgi:uncharacterized alpha-E superfamily protein
MLSRVAEKMYWYGRYFERAENTARLMRVYTNVLLDMPGGVKHIWEDLIKITGSSQLFYEKFKQGNERSVIKFMLTDRSNPASLLCSVSAARENARTTREIIPAEAWEKINEFFLYVRNNSDAALKQNTRHRFLSEVIDHCYQMTGLLFGNMSHGNAYHFIRMGRNLERADMTTRILDVGCINLLQEQANIPDAYDNILWMNVLKSLGAYQMYRQHVKDRVNGEAVVDYLIKDNQFPRSVRHCLIELENCFTKISGHEQPLREVIQTHRKVNKVDTAALMQAGLHEFIDELQIEFAEIHNAVGQTWFGHGKSQSQQQ